MQTGYQDWLSNYQELREKLHKVIDKAIAGREEALQESGDEYSQYNQGWVDGVDFIIHMLEDEGVF